jgi:hypothetical protein
MAEAGFIFCGSKDEPDLVHCQVCLKKLDGWEEDDSPWYVVLCFEKLMRRESWCCIRTLAKVCWVRLITDFMFLCCYVDRYFVRSEDHKIYIFN